MHESNAPPPVSTKPSRSPSVNTPSHRLLPRAMDKRYGEKVVEMATECMTAWNGPADRGEGAVASEGQRPRKKSVDKNRILCIECRVHICHVMSAVHARK